MRSVQITNTHLVAPRGRLYGFDPKARPDAAVADLKRQFGKYGVDHRAYALRPVDSRA